jgi:hypothetical protein
VSRGNLSLAEHLIFALAIAFLLGLLLKTWVPTRPTVVPPMVTPRDGATGGVL